MRSFPLRRALLLVGIVAWSVAVSAAAADTSDPFLCYDAAPASAPRGTTPYPAFAPIGGVIVVDRFISSDPHDHHAVDLRAVDGLCAPAGVAGGDVVAPTIHLEGYRLRQTVTRPRQPSFAPRAHTVTDGVHQRSLVVSKPEALFLRSAVAVGKGGAPQLDAPAADDFQCYRARGTTPQTSERLSVADGFGERVYDVGRPSRLCVPADKDGTSPGAPAHPGELLCRRARVARMRPRQARPAEILVSTHDALGVEVLRVAAPRELCVPVTAVPDPSTTPVSVPSPTPTSPTPGPDATLLRITIRPPEIARLPTEVKHFWATGQYSDGGTRDLTNEVVWASSNPTVASAANDPADPNRIDLHVQGTASISATHPPTGVSSTTTGDDAILHVTGPLQFIVIHPFTGRASRDGYEQFTAVGYFQEQLGANSSYVERNLTQEVQWSVTDPAVATAENRVGDRSRIIAAAPGITGVYATDPATGIHSYYCDWPDAYKNPPVPAVPYCYAPRLMVFGDLRTISLVRTGSPHKFYNMKIGDQARLAAVGLFEGGGYKLITQECTFAADDPTIFGTPNVPGDRGVIVALGGGTTNIRATHDATGIVSAPFSHYVYGKVLGYVIPAWMLRPTASALFPFAPFGPADDITAIYEHGTGPLQPLSWEVTVDDLTVATPNGIFLVPLKPGVVHAGMRDPDSGAESTERRQVTFYGDVQRVILDPPFVALRVGGEDQLTTLAEQEGGYRHNVTQDSSYSSNDPGVVDAPDEWTWPPHRSRIVAVAPGEAIVSAKFDGRSTADSGDDTFVSVVGDFTTLTVTPAEAVTSAGRGFQFTATGGDAANRTINVTQTVDWSSSDPTIASATNPAGDRSRIVGIAPGTVTITATDGPSGQTATATLTVLGAIGSLALLPESEALAVGDTDYLTAVGIAADGTLNLTQDVTYASDAPSIVAVDNDDDVRSRIVAVAPGTAHITATDPVSGLVSDPTLVMVHPGP